MCPTIPLYAFSRSVLAALRARFGAIDADGIGLGVCGDVNAGLEYWNVSSRIHDWRFADEAVRIIDAELRIWGVDGEYGLSVTPLSCGTPL